MTYFQVPGEARSSVRGYVTGILIILTGVAAFVWHLVDSLDQLSRSSARAIVPGSVQVELTRPGTYTFFNEWRSVLDGRPVRSGLDLTVNNFAVVRLRDGEPLRLTPNTSMRYSYGPRQGYAVGDLYVEEPGAYGITVEVPVAGDKVTVVTLIYDFTSRLIWLIAVSIVIMFFALALGGWVIMRTYRSRLREQYRPPGPVFFPR